MTSTKQITAPFDDDRPTRRRFDNIAEWVGVFGVCGIVASFEGLPWLAGAGGPDTGFLEISAYGGTGPARGLVGAWFPWLAWPAIAMVIVLALVARCATTRVRVWRSVAVLAVAALAAADVAATAAARGVGDLPTGFGPGLWLAVGGCALIALCVLLPAHHDEEVGDDPQ